MEERNTKNPPKFLAYGELKGANQNADRGNENQM